MAAKKKRRMSAYNLFTKKCMLEGKSMKECAGEWKLIKGTDREKELLKEVEEMNKRVMSEEGADEDSSEDTSRKELEGTHINIGEYDKVMLVTSDGCPSCEEWKEAFKPLIESGLVKLADIQKDDEAVDAAMELGLTAVPAIVGVKGGKYERIG